MRRAIPFVFLAIAILAATVPLWWHPAPFYVMDDGMGHLFRMLEFDRVIHEGVFYPRWAPDLAFGYGYPVFNFYAPLTDYLAETLHLFGLTLPDAIKAMFALAVLLGASGAYVLGKDLFQDNNEKRLISSLIAAAYILFPYFLLDLYTRAAIAEALGAALLPWLICMWRRLLYSQTVASVALAALFSAALVLTHNLTALVAVPVLGVYLVWEWLHLPWRRRVKPIWTGALAAALGASLSAIYWLPLFAELSLVGMSRADKQLWVLVEENLLSLQNVIQMSWAYQYVGAPFPLALTPLLLGLLGALVVLVSARGKSERTPIVFFSAVAFISILLMVDWTKSIWLYLPLLRSIQFPWRLSVFVGLGVALAIGGLVDSSIQSRWFESMRTRSARAAQWIGFAFAAALVGLCVWVSVSNLSLRRMNNLQGDVALPQLVRFEMDQRTIGLGTMNEYMPLTIQALPRRLNPDAAPAAKPEIRLLEYNSYRRAFTVSSSQPISITLHAFYFPDWRVTVDDQMASAYPTTPMGLLTVDVPAGIHRVQAELVDTPPRRIGAFLSGVGALILVTLTAWVLLRRRAEAFGVTLSLAVGIALTAPVALRAAQAQPPTLQSINTDIAPELTLIGVQIENALLSSDAWHIAGVSDSLRVSVYWQVKRSLQDKPTAWRLVDANGRALAARELYPRYAGGLPLTWVPNEIVPDHYDLPLDPNMPAGRYAVQVSYGDSRQYSTVTNIELAQGSAPAQPKPAIQHQFVARLGDSIQFVGYSLGAPLQRGQTSPVVLYWKAERPVPLDYTAFVQLIDGQGNLVAQHDSLTGDGFNTSTLWVPGEVVQDWHGLHVPRDVKPGLYRLIAGLYLYENYTRLPVADETGAKSPDDVIELGEIKILMNEAVQPTHALAVSMGSSIHLLGYDLASVNERGQLVSRSSGDTPARLTVQPSQTLQVKLYWQARGEVNADYKVFVHLVDEQGQVAAQRDVLPGDNQYPTRIWEKDERVVDDHLLPLRGLPAGQYRIVVGMYDPQTGERLPSVDALGNGLPDHATPVGVVEVQNP